MNTNLVPHVRCCQCEWTPDPARRMAPENQANEHGDKAGHVVEYGMDRPVTITETSGGAP